MLDRSMRLLSREGNLIDLGNTSNIGKGKNILGSVQTITGSDVAVPSKIMPISLEMMNLSAVNADFFSNEFMMEGDIEYNIQTGSPFNATMQAAHGSSAISHAGQTHPGTQMVAAQISKSAQNGDTDAMTLDLDPPELGRVKVRLEFGDDKSVRAHLTIEKPETYMMLQRDANSLEKALQDAGLDTTGDTLNFEMASDDFFEQDSKHSGQHTKQGNDHTSFDELEILETQMTMLVDPDTGHIRYNIMA